APDQVCFSAEDLPLLTVPGIPKLHGPIHAGRKEVDAVAAERDVGDPTAGAQVQHLAAAGEVPDADGLVGACRGEAPAVAAERQALDRARVPGEGEDRLPGGRIPEADALITARYSKPFPVGAEGEVLVLGNASGYYLNLLATGPVPAAHRSVP